MTVAELLRRVSSREITEWIAFDKIEDDLVRPPLASHAAPAGSRWIELNDPDVFTKLKERMGMV